MKDQNLFKQKLYHHTMPVPDDLWGKIEAQLPANKKRFPFFWFSMAAGLVAGGALVILLATQDVKQDNKPATAAPVEATAVNMNPTTGNAGTEQGNGEQSTSIQPAGSEEEITTAISKSENNVNTNIESSAKDKSHYRTTAATKKLVSSKAENSTVTLTALADAEESSATSITNLTRIHHATENIALCDVNFFYARNGESAAIDKIKPDPNCYKFTGDNGVSRLSVDLFGGPGFAPRTFQDTGGETPQYVEARKLTEHSQYAWSAGARVNYYLNRGFAIRAGLMYEQIGDLFDYKDSLAFQITTQIDSFFSADGTFLYAETNTVLKYGTTIKKIHNRYHHIDVPLLASYELPLGRYTLMLNAGPVLNLSTSFRGQILDPGLAPKHITPSERNAISVYKTNLGLSIYLGAGALIPVNDNITAVIEPRFLYRIKPVTLESYPIEEKRHFAGLNLGIRYHFN